MVHGKLSGLCVPSFGFVNGAALGWGLEIAFNSTYPAVDASAAAIALPEVFLGIMPFQLIDTVGWKVAAHVQDTMADAFADRFFASQSFHQPAELPEVVEKDKSGRVTEWTKPAEKILKGAVGSLPATEEEILRRVQHGLAEEIRIMLDEGVVPGVEDIEICLILGGLAAHRRRRLPLVRSRRPLGAGVRPQFHHPRIQEAARTGGRCGRRDCRSHP